VTGSGITVLAWGPARGPAPLNLLERCPCDRPRTGGFGGSWGIVVPPYKTERLPRAVNVSRKVQCPILFKINSLTDDKRV